MATNQVLIVHLPRQHLDFARSTGLIPIQVKSWRKDALHKGSLKELICHGTGVDQSRCTIRNVYAPIQLPGEEDDGSPLMRYFTAFFSWSYGRATAEIGGAGKQETHLVVNLMPFSFPASPSASVIFWLRR